jgi:bisphosphoglycerate-independent phosphoglycerate mutase (AlkP superfamily)
MTATEDRYREGVTRWAAGDLDAAASALEALWSALRSIIERFHPAAGSKVVLTADDGTATEVRLESRLTRSTWGRRR